MTNELGLSKRQKAILEIIQKQGHLCFTDEGEELRAMSYGRVRRLMMKRYHVIRRNLYRFEEFTITGTRKKSFNASFPRSVKRLLARELLFIIWNKHTKELTIKTGKIVKDIDERRNLIDPDWKKYKKDFEKTVAPN